MLCLQLFALGQRKVCLNFLMKKKTRMMLIILSAYTSQFHLISVFAFLLPYLLNVLMQTVNNAFVFSLDFMICPLLVNTAMWIKAFAVYFWCVCIVRVCEDIWSHTDKTHRFIGADLGNTVSIETVAMTTPPSLQILRSTFFNLPNTYCPTAYLFYLALPLCFRNTHADSHTNEFRILHQTSN